MGAAASFFSNQLAGGVINAQPAISYTYNAGNTKYLGFDGTYFAATSTRGGEITPQITVATYGVLTCKPITISAQGQSVLCPIPGTAINGLVTLGFYGVESTLYVDPGTATTYRSSVGTANTRRDFGPDYTYSFAPQAAPATVTVSVTPTPSAFTTVTSGVATASPTSTATIPATTVTVTVYSTTQTSVSSSASTSGSTSVVTVTATCGPATPVKCTSNNCLRALRGRPESAGAFCSTYTASPGQPTPTYLAGKCDGSPAKVSSACTCYASGAAKRGAGPFTPTYAPPDQTFYPVVGPVATTTFGPVTTVTSGPVPSSTSTQPNPTVSAGTSTATRSTVTSTVVITRTTATSVTTSTSTFTPVSCRTAP